MKNEVKKIVIEILMLPDYYNNIEFPNIRHIFSEATLGFTVTTSIIEDPRDLPEAPIPCCCCKWLKNNECWFKGKYYGQDFECEYDMNLSPLYEHCNYKKFWQEWDPDYDNYDPCGNCPIYHYDQFKELIPR